jgi:hypothetical protein
MPPVLLLLLPLLMLLWPLPFFVAWRDRVKGETGCRIDFLCTMACLLAA